MADDERKLRVGLTVVVIFTSKAEVGLIYIMECVYMLMGKLK